MDTNFEDDFEIVDDVYVGEDFFEADALSATEDSTSKVNLSESLNNENFFSANTEMEAVINGEVEEEEKEHKLDQIHQQMGGKKIKKKKKKKKKMNDISKQSKTTSNTAAIESNYNLISTNTTSTNTHVGLQLHQEFEQELKCIKKLKLKMEKKCMKYESLVNETQELNKVLKHSLKRSEKERLDLCSIRKTFMNDCSLLSDILTSLKLNEKKTSVPAVDDVFHIHENRELLMSLRSYFSECKNMTNEMKRIKVMREQQQQLINECKIGLQTMHTSHIDNCLQTLDKSKAYECKECGIDIALCEDIESKCYQVGQGSFSEKKRGYLFSNAVNVVFGEEKTEHFTTGAYQISWVSCLKCMSKIGWKYISADNNTNNTKVGKYCLARYSLSSPEDRIQQT